MYVCMSWQKKTETFLLFPELQWEEEKEESTLDLEN